MTSKQQVFKIFEKNFMDMFLLLFPLEILSNYPDIDFSHWPRENFYRMMDKVFREKLSV